MASIFRQTYTKRDPKTGKKIRKKVARWYIEYRDEHGHRKRVPGFTDKEMTRQLSRELETKAEAIRRGLIHPHELHVDRPLKEHVADFLEYLRAKGDTERYVLETEHKLARIRKDCQFGIWRDISASRFTQWLMDSKQKHDWGASTYNGYIKALFGFCKWLVLDQRAPNNPVQHVKRRNERTDRKHVRRILSCADFAKLMDAARGGKPVLRLAWEARVALYSTAALTGFRAQELASMTPSSFDLDAKPPTVRVLIGSTKSKREHSVLPIRADLAKVLRPYLATKQPDEILWPGTWQSGGHAAQLVQHDLKVAGIPYKDAEGNAYDFHALRHQFVTAAFEAGLNLKVIQMLARHTNPAITLGHYAHASLQEQADGLDRLKIKLTGGHTGTAGASRHELASAGTNDDDATSEKRSRELEKPAAQPVVEKYGCAGEDTCEINQQPEEARSPRQAVAVALQPTQNKSVASDELACLQASIQDEPTLRFLAHIWSSLPAHAREEILTLVIRHACRGPPKPAP